MERTETPTTARLQELREQGIVPLSVFSSRSAATLLVLLSFLMLRTRFSVVVQALHDFVRGGAPEPWFQGENQHAVVAGVLSILIVPASAAFIGAILCGLFQTRFLVLLSRVSPALERINPFAASRFLGIIHGIIFGAATVLLLFFFSLVLLRLIIVDILALLHQEAQNLLSASGRFFEAVLPLLILVLAFAGFFSWLTVRNRFFAAHRMTREEVLRENEDRS